jgi:hypothetical protein
VRGPTLARLAIVFVLWQRAVNRQPVGPGDHQSYWRGFFFCIFHFAMFCRKLANAQPNDRASEIDFGQTPTDGKNADFESQDRWLIVFSRMHG